MFPIPIKPFEFNSIERARGRERGRERELAVVVFWSLKQLHAD
jgi:hypothetical protein